MSVIIIGGHDRVVSQYKKVYRNYKCKAKVFTQMSTNLDKRIDSLGLLILFANTASHKTIRCALDEAGNGTEIVCRHTSSGTAPIEIPEEKCAVCALQAFQSIPLLHLQHL